MNSSCKTCDQVLKEGDGSGHHPATTLQQQASLCMYAETHAAEPLPCCSDPGLSRLQLNNARTVLAIHQPLPRPAATGNGRQTYTTTSSSSSRGQGRQLPDTGDTAYQGIHIKPCHPHNAPQS
jgi:hypothetical protein